MPNLSLTNRNDIHQYIAGKRTGLWYSGKGNALHVGGRTFETRMGESLVNNNSRVA